MNPAFSWIHFPRASLFSPQKPSFRYEKLLCRRSLYFILNMRKLKNPTEGEVFTLILNTWGRIYRSGFFAIYTVFTLGIRFWKWAVEALFRLTNLP